MPEQDFYSRFLNDYPALLAEAKEAARANVAKELREMMRARLPKVFAKLKKQAQAPVHNGKPTESSIKAEIHAAMAQAMVENRKFAAKFFLQRIADEHLHRFVYDAIVSEVNHDGVVFIAEAVEAVRTTLGMYIELYPEIAKPRMPRRSDISRLVRRFCERPWKVDARGRTVFKGE